MHPAGDLVRAGVARADRLRRSRETARQVWRAAPIAAAIALALAGGSRWAGWPVFVPLGALALGGAALVASVYTTRRDRAVSDAAAAAIDAQAGLGGELRSAHWFSARDTDNPWVDLHLGRAAPHVDGIDWVRLYPAVRARGAKIASAAMALGALALALSVPGTAGVHAGDPAIAGAARAKAASVTSLPADLQKELEDLLAAAEAGMAPDGGRALTASELRTLLSRIAQLRALQAANDGKAAPRSGARTDAIPDDLEPLAERLKRASEMASLSPEVRDAFADLAEKLGDASDAQAATPKDPKDATASADPRAGAAAQSKKAGDKDEMSIQSVKDASAGGGAGVIMMSNQDAGGGKEAGLGLGGSSEQTSGRGRMADLGAALRKETIEAKTDNPGENVETAIRRKTERGDATLAYTRTAPRAFERGRSSAPPAVPEGRRAGVHAYFIRKQ
jgi:hypothetical protein